MKEHVIISFIQTVSGKSIVRGKGLWREIQRLEGWPVIEMQKFFPNLLILLLEMAENNLQRNLT